MMTRRRPYPVRRSAVLFLASLAGALALASGEVWRYPPRFHPAVGPSLVDLAAADEKPKKAGRSLKLLEVAARNGEGAPVPGIAMHVSARFGNKGPYRADGATDADGRFVVRNAGATVITLTFSWDSGAKTIDARLESNRDGWRVASAPYTRVVDRVDEGSCRNLFALRRLEEGRYRLEFRQPAALLECEEVSYGADRKADEMAHLSGIGRRDVNQGDKNMFSPDDEIRMGVEASDQFDSQLTMIDDPQIVGYVQGVMEKVVASSDQPGMPVHLRVVHTTDVNAFVTAGGHVYVFTGLLAAAENESQLAGVLAHEASHAIARHVTEGATRNMKAQLGALAGSLALGQILGLENRDQAILTTGSTAATGMVLLRYDRRAETEADLLGAQYLWNAGWDPEGIARFFEILERESGGSSVPGWLSTHPSHEHRIENGILWSRAFLPPRERYLVDTAEFRAAQARVAALPPPPERPAGDGAKSLHQLMAETPTWQRMVERGRAQEP